ncbi:hypothetical protein M1525_00755, partial [Patescibacteria group bacterium]|nr:hypothetical protein [Patescibacteria group bacterium]
PVSAKISLSTVFALVSPASCFPPGKTQVSGAPSFPFSTTFLLTIKTSPFLFLTMPRLTRLVSAIKLIIIDIGLKIKAVKQISLRIHPQFTKIICYFICNLEKSNQIQKPQETDEIEKIKWVKPEELRSYFTTDLDPNVAKKLGLS